jgi:hypothetical protein
MLHFFSDQRIQDGRIISGTINLSDGSGTETNVAAVTIHPGYGVVNGNPVNDIAIAQVNIILKTHSSGETSIFRFSFCSIT